MLLRASVGLHAAGLAALALDPARWPLVLGALVADHAVIGAAVLSPRSLLLGANLTRRSTSVPTVCLTFDDGPDPEVTPAVLDLLDRHRARATFFCIGAKVARHPGLAAEVRRRGHAVENHTWSHPHLFGFHSARRMEGEIRRAQDAIEEATGRRPSFFRAPVGIRNPWLDGVLVREGLTLVSWTRRGYDGLSSDVARVSDRLLRGLFAGDILLLHDGSSLRRAGRPIVLDVLPRVLDALTARGLASVPIEPPGLS